MVGEEHRLGPLQVRVAGHDHVLVASSQFEERLLHSSESSYDIDDRFLGVEPQVHGYLVVSRPGRVQSSRRRADELVQAALDVHVQVFQVRVPGESLFLDFLLDGGQALGDLGRVLLGDDALLGQHLGVGHRPGDVLLIQAPVVIDGNGIAAEIGHNI